jgi:hypothetical protein
MVRARIQMHLRDTEGIDNNRHFRTPPHLPLKEAFLRSG